MLDIKALEHALASIGELGKEEMTFEVDGTAITIRVLSPEENFACQKFARTEGDATEFPLFMERYKRMLLGYAIVQIGAIDLRSEKYIDSGEVNADGVAIRVEKHVAVRKIIERQGWSGTILQYMFTKYGDLQRKSDIEAERNVRFFPPDLDAEIERLQTRLQELNTERDRLLTPAPAQSAIVDAVQQAGSLVQEQHKRLLNGEESVQTHTAPEPEPQVAPVEPQVVPVEPPPVVPPVRSRILPPVAPPPPRVAPQPTHADLLPDVRDSFSDGSDEDLAEEENRLARARMAAARLAAQVELPMDDIITPPRGRGVPHAGAAPTAARVEEQLRGSVDSAELQGLVNDIPAYRLPAEVLSARGQTPRPGKPVVNTMSTGWTNPRFKKSDS